jgi:flagellar protein FliT
MRNLRETKETRIRDMATTSEVVHCYGQLAFTTSRMLELARAKQWEHLPQLDTHCTSIVDRLRTIEAHERLEPLGRAQVRSLVARILADQDELSALVRPQMERLVRKLDQLQRQGNLNRAYRPLS